MLYGEPFSVFAKLGAGTDAREQFTAELDGLTLLSRAAGIRTPVPVADGVIDLGAGALLLFEALAERPPGARQREDWRSIGQALAALHGVRHPRFGLGDGRGFFGPLPQDNRPVPANLWPDFYLERRLAPALHTAVGSGHLPADLAAGVERVAARLPDLCGPEPRPSLLHGDAQQNNFISTADGAVAIDPAPISATRRSTWPRSTSSTRCPPTCSPPTARPPRSTRASLTGGSYGGCPPTSP